MPRKFEDLTIEFSHEHKAGIAERYKSYAAGDESAKDYARGDAGLGKRVPSVRLMLREPHWISLHI
jgi:hypothetical protein